MKRKYKLLLFFIGSLLSISAIFGIGYGVWVNTRDDYNVEAKNLDCFKIYIDSTDVVMHNITSVTAEEGKQNSPYSLTVTNICSVDKDLQVRLAILDETTVDIKSLTIDATGNINIDEKFYIDLDDAKSNMDNIKYNKLLSKITIKPNETIRTNFKIWFDERKNPSISKDDILSARFELIDGDARLSISLKDKIISSYQQKDNLVLSELATENEGLISITNTNGTNYYYRGAINNNYISFAGELWRIVGINEDGTIKIILQGNAGESKFGDNVNYKDYVGLTYDHNGKIVENAILKYLNNWYQEKIVATNMDEYVAVKQFCNDTSFTLNNKQVIYGGYNRIVTASSPSIMCPERSSDFGGSYNQKIGLITADEVVLAGGIFGANNETFYLNNGTNYYTLTPSDYNSNSPQMITVNSMGALSVNNVKDVLGIRPVINLVNTINVIGAGTESNPYIVDYQ